MKTVTWLPRVLPAWAALPRHRRRHGDGPASSLPPAASIRGGTCCSPNLLHFRFWFVFFFNLQQHCASAGCGGS